jgi:biopolymer transport protein ExbB
MGVRTFQQQQAQQTRLLQEAQQEKARQEALSEQRETTFDENDLLIADVQQQLEERLGSLRELFGVWQQVAGDARSTFENSLTNIEYPDRAQFLTDLANKMGSSSQLPSIEEIEQLWFELQREATEVGKIKRLTDFRLISADGQEVFEDIVRVGPFNIVADGRYLTHNVDTNSVSELQRQPGQARFLDSTSAISRTYSSTVVSRCSLSASWRAFSA